MFELWSEVTPQRPHIEASFSLLIRAVAWQFLLSNRCRIFLIFPKQYGNQWLISREFHVRQSDLVLPSCFCFCPSPRHTKLLCITNSLTDCSAYCKQQEIQLILFQPAPLCCMHFFIDARIVLKVFQAILVCGCATPQHDVFMSSASWHLASPSYLILPTLPPRTVSEFAFFFLFFLAPLSLTLTERYLLASFAWMPRVNMQIMLGAHRECRN